MCDIKKSRWVSNKVASPLALPSWEIDTNIISSRHNQDGFHSRQTPHRSTFHGNTRGQKRWPPGSNTSNTPTNQQTNDRNRSSNILSRITSKFKGSNSKWVYNGVYMCVIEIFPCVCDVLVFPLFFSLNSPFTSSWNTRNSLYPVLLCCSHSHCMSFGGGIYHKHVLSHFDGQIHCNNSRPDQLLETNEMRAFDFRHESR